MLKRLLNSKPIKWIRYIRQQLQNQRQNRQLIGQDRDGNKYYQYYSYWGLPTRRQIRFRQKGNFDMTDLVYYRWLHNQQFDPPSEAQKQQFYLQQKIRYQRALQWDNKQKNLLEQFRKKRQQLALRNQALLQLERQMQQNSKLTNIKTKRGVNSNRSDDRSDNSENIMKSQVNMQKNQQRSDKQGDNSQVRNSNSQRQSLKQENRKY